MNGKQKRHLRSVAHTLKPVVNLGKHGLSPEIKNEIGLSPKKTARNNTARGK